MRLPDLPERHRSYWDDLMCLKFGAVIAAGSVAGVFVMFGYLLLFGVGR